MMVIVIFTVLAIGIPLAFLSIAIGLVYRIVVPVKRQMPEDLPSNLFDGKPASTATVEANEAATSEFKKSFGAKGFPDVVRNQRVLLHSEAMLSQPIPQYRVREFEYR